MVRKKMIFELVAILFAMSVLSMASGALVSHGAPDDMSPLLQDEEQMKG
jgi:hypothetical protein